MINTMSFNQGVLKMKDNSVEYIENKTKATPIAMVAPEVKHNSDILEITKTCAVLGCEDFKNLDTDSFFRFPEDPNFRQIWTDLMGRNNWTPTDYSYVCIQHFSVDCFTCDAANNMVLVDKAVPSLKLPKHVLEIEYIDEDSLDNDEDDYEMESEEDEKETTQLRTHTTQVQTQTTLMKTQATQTFFKEVNGNAHSSASMLTRLNEKLDEKKRNGVHHIETLKLFGEVQRMQRQAVGLQDKLKYNMKMYNRQTRALARIKDVIRMKKNVLEQKRKKKTRLLLSLQDKIKEDTNGLVLAMPSRQTDDVKNFALSIYKYSPQSYIYIRNMLRTALPSTEVLDSWLSSGYQGKNVMLNRSLIKVVTEQTENELSCKVSLG